MMEPYPVAAADALDHIIILEGDCHPIHGHIIKQNIIQHKGNHQEIEGGVCAHFFAETLEEGSAFFHICIDHEYFSPV